MCVFYLIICVELWVYFRVMFPNWILKVGLWFMVKFIETLNSDSWIYVWIYIDLFELA
jgi:hypothetical protein